ncbi:MAG: AmmeMemoRadiSam system protein B [Nanoarchaeota archaeon]|nr:AmmeMemoRadiSam system protein B [Nanoarchaeota archaeon]
MVRQPIVSGQFYEAYPDRLKDQIKWCFQHELGPGLPGKGDKKIIAVICPHAGYSFSGPCAAHSYKQIAGSEADSYIILGISHQGYGSCVSLDDWETPLGVVKNDTELVKMLMDNSGLKKNEKAHSHEHSIEVQLPFLQYVQKEPKIVPVIISEDIDIEGFAKAVIKTIKDSGKKIIIIVSGDFTHYGINYGFMPFSDNVKENLKKLDMGAFKFIEKLDYFHFLDYIDKTRATICGRLPIAAICSISKLLKASEVKLLKYYTSGDITDDYTSAVGYASILIR